MSLFGSKPALSSGTIWGGLLSMSAGAWQVVQSAIESGTVPPAVTPYVALVGGLLAVVNRFRAERKIKGVFNGSGSSF